MSVKIDGQTTWTFLTNHFHVLLSLVRNSDSTLREVAETVGITERAVQHIVHDLEEGGYITIEKAGRRNRYQINMERNLRHPLEEGCQVGALIALVK